MNRWVWMAYLRYHAGRISHEELQRIIKAKRGRHEECEVCGKELPVSRLLVVGEAFQDDHRLGIEGDGGTFMAAYYCRAHKPQERTR